MRAGGGRGDLLAAAGADAFEERAHRSRLRVTLQATSPSMCRSCAVPADGRGRQHDRPRRPDRPVRSRARTTPQLRRWAHRPKDRLMAAAPPSDWATALRACCSCCRLPALERLRGARALTLAAPAGVSVEFVGRPPINSTLDWIRLPPWSRRADGPRERSPRGRLATTLVGSGYGFLCSRRISKARTMSVMPVINAQIPAKTRRT